ncbi:MAG: ACP S-malonyltransferase, partial [Verrucomicrobiae bacterium]|nr:ACP S-malonyltransferase [Verrucomicrobiae bacterium]
DVYKRQVQARGRFMQEACEATAGSMASVLGLDDAVVAEICRETDVDVANLNCPGQVVISGERSKLEQAIELCKARGAKRVIPLAVAGAYHSRLMQHAREKFAEAAASVPLTAPRVPVVANVTAQPAISVAEIRELLIRQITSSVRWTQSMQWLIEHGFNRFVELGPGAVLSGLMKRINKDVEVLTVNDCASLDNAVAKLRS